MKQLNITSLLFVLLSMTGLSASAHDIAVKNGDDVTFYYNFINGNELQVTYKGYSYSDYSNEYTGDVVIPESVTYEGISYSVTSIGESAFESCEGVTSVTIPDCVTNIGGDAFYGTAWYNNQPNGLVYAGKFAYKYKGTMPKNTSITIEEGTWGIADEAFFHFDKELVSVTIPNSVTSIGDKAFYYCTSLASLDIPNSVTSIGEYAFAETAWYKSLPDGMVYAGKVAYGYKGTMPDNTSITIKDGTLSIAGSAFSNCTALTSIDIPNSVKGIGFSAFYKCSKLTSVTIPNSVTNMGERAFAYCTGLTSVNIPNSMKSIETAVFQYCSALTTVTIPDGVTSIGNSSFSDCTALTSIDIPNSVKSIGSYAFYGCTGLTSVTIPNSVTSIGNNAFSGCSNLNNVYNESTAPQNLLYNPSFNYSTATLHVPEGTKESYKAANYWYYFTTIVDDIKTAVNNVNGNVSLKVNNIFSIDGKTLSQPQKGISIQKMSDGTTRKIVAQ